MKLLQFASIAVETERERERERETFICKQKQVPGGNVRQSWRLLHTFDVNM